ncbi:excisionase family DNA-binding protein [Polaribacter sp. P097]|uniref:excisionase family DNA-binding protein n=1 Tax=Polaribacter sp. P097 TaxID=3117398 RepID=UPI002FE1EC07
MSSNIYLLKNCQQCNKTFTARTTVTKYCGSSCSKKAWKLRKRAEKINTAISVNEITSNSKDNTNTFLNTNKEYLSITEASQLIGVSRWTIQRMVQNGRLKAVPFGRKRILSKKQIENLFNE